MRRTVDLISQWKLDESSGPDLHFEQCKGGYFSTNDEYGLKVVGKTYQTTTTGKNIFGGTALRDKLVSLGGVDNGDGTVTISAANLSSQILFDGFEPNAQYTIMVKGKNTNASSPMESNVNAYYVDSGVFNTKFAADENTFGIATSTAGKTVGSWKGIWSTGSSVFKYNECGIFKGVLTADEFEPYCGGKNLCPPFVENDHINPSNGSNVLNLRAASTRPIPVDFNVTPTLIVTGLLETALSFIAAYEIDGTFVGRTSNNPKTEYTMTKNIFTDGDGNGNFDNIAYLRIIQYGNANNPATIEDIMAAQVQLERGSTASPYEPYRGDGLSPSPYNPQPIQCVKAGTMVWSHGKNLYDGVSCINGYISGNVFGANTSCRSIIIPCLENTTYTVSKTKGSILGVGYLKEYPQGGTPAYGYLDAHDKTVAKITTGADAKYLIVYIYSDSTDVELTVEEILATIQIELGSTKTPYEPYCGNKITTPCDLYEGDIWYPMSGRVVRVNAVKAATGEENLELVSTYSNDNVTFFQIRQFFDTVSIEQNTASGYSNRFVCSLSTMAVDLPAGLFGTGGSSFTESINVRIDSSLAATVEEMKEILVNWYNEGNPATFIVPLTEPIIEQYDPMPIFAPPGIVNVTQTQNELTADLSATMLVHK